MPDRSLFEALNEFIIRYNIVIKPPTEEYYITNNVIKNDEELLNKALDFCYKQHLRI